MKHIIIFFALLFSTNVFSQQAHHVVLINIDGFRPDFYLDKAWETPTLRQLMKKGTYAKGVNSVFPSMTYPSHTTIVTGVWPAKHGVYYNGLFEPAGKIYWNDSSIKVPTLWKAAQQKGLKTASLFWPVSADAPVAYNIPDIGSMGETVREQYSKPQGFVDEVRKNVFNGISRIEYGKDQNVAAIAAYVIKLAKPNLMAVHLFSVDHFQHEQGRQGPLVQAAVRDADSSVSIIINALKEAGIWDKTVLIVTGDHGFMDVHTSVNPNVWLAKAGLVSDSKNDDWKARFYSVSGSSYLYLKDKNDVATLQQVSKLLADLPADEKKYFRIIDRKKLDKIGGNPEVALAISAENGASLGNAITGEAIKPGHGGAHGYLPDFREIQTGFIACGPGIKTGGVIAEMNLRDIAPAIASILSLSMSSADGKVPSGLFKK